MLRSALKARSGAQFSRPLFRPALNTSALFQRSLHTRQPRPAGAISLSSSRSHGPPGIWRDPRVHLTPVKVGVGAGSIRLRPFHTTPPRHSLPLLPLLAGIFKVSTVLESVRIIGRVTLSVAPVLLVKNLNLKKKLRHKQAQGYQISEEKMNMVLKKMRRRTLLFHALLFTPVILFWLVIIASLERTPLTGRWRTILLSPEEEDEIAAQLAGDGWYNAVREIVAQDNPRGEIGPNDWRYRWVNDVLRQLETTIPILQNERALQDLWLQEPPNGCPLPPPAEYPLQARPRAIEMLLSMCEAMGNGAKLTPPKPASHGIPGPPYSLMVVDQPDLANAFSYGFGPDGGGGIVVYSGFLDEILSTGSETDTPASQPPQPAQPTSWFSALFGGVSTQPPAPPPHPVPTPEQTSKLAILLAHELSHLILAHHLETLSSWSIVMPGMVSILADFARVLIFPITFIFGPFVNDAIANVGKMSTGDFTRIAEFCTSMKQEIEADIVSARLLAYAGYDPRATVSFWEHRTQSPQNAESSLAYAKQIETSAVENAQRLALRITGGKTHPLNETRVLRLREELQRWEDERAAALKRIRKCQECRKPPLAPAAGNAPWIAPYSRLWSAAP